MTSLIDKLAQLGIEPLNSQKFEPLSGENILRLQIKIGTPLPEAYVQLLTTFGSSMFSGEINCKPHGEPLYFGWFYGFDELIDAMNTYREVLPASIIPIGDDGGGNQFCLGVMDNDIGKVYFHNHSIGWHTDAEAESVARGQIPAGIRYQTVCEISPSFEQFVLGMSRED